MAKARRTNPEAQKLYDDLDALREHKILTAAAARAYEQMIDRTATEALPEHEACQLQAIHLFGRAYRPSEVFPRFKPPLPAPERSTEIAVEEPPPA